MREVGFVSMNPHFTTLLEDRSPRRVRMDASHALPYDDAALDVTALLRAHVAGDPDALARLLPRVYDTLRRIARGRLRHEWSAHDLSVTEVVHDALLALLPMNRVDWQSRAHFFAVVSRAMRNVLVDHASRRRALKRGGGTRALPLHQLADQRVPAHETSIDEIIDVNDALTRLERIEPRKARVVECRVFGGLTLHETAEALRISVSTVSRDWTAALAWLGRELNDAPSRVP